MCNMKHSQIDQLTDSLSVALKTLEDRAQSGENTQLTTKQISQVIRKIPYGGLTGDQISGGKITNFVVQVFQIMLVIQWLLLPTKV